jgi:murein DD-endopeptidase
VCERPHRRKRRPAPASALRQLIARIRAVPGLLVALLLAGCATVPTRPPPQPPPPALAAPADTGGVIASIAASLVGTRYQFGGADQGGFDCSGLALYVHERVGLAIPRTAAAQQRAAQAIPRAQLAPGDLVFFRLRSRSVDHVGIYAGEGRFIHAPRAGRAVTFADLGGGFYAQHFAAGGRFWQQPATARCASDGHKMPPTQLSPICDTSERRDTFSDLTAIRDDLTLGPQ